MAAVPNGSSVGVLLARDVPSVHPATSCPMKPLPGYQTLALSLALAGALSAQTAPTGTITGRVFNPATGEYVRNAEISVVGTNQSAVSGEGGQYTLPNVP